MSIAPADEYGPFTVADYDALPDDDQRHELINGWIVVSSPTPVHNRVAFKLMNAIEEVLPLGYAVNGDIDISMADRRQCLRPDAVITTQQWAEGWLRTPASAILLAVEVLSPGSKRTDRETKPRIYAAAGVQTYWLVETEPFAVTEFQLAGRWYQEVQRVTGDEIVVSQPFDLTVDLSAARAVTVRAANRPRMEEA